VCNSLCCCHCSGVEAAEGEERGDAAARRFLPDSGSHAADRLTLSTASITASQTARRATP